MWCNHGLRQKTVNILLRQQHRCPSLTVELQSLCENMSFMDPFVLAAKRHVHRLDGQTTQGDATEKNACRASNGDTLAEGAPVVIAGAGPTGLTTSILLAELGIPSVVLERHPRHPQHPKAHLMNHRTMEIFRGMSGLASDIVQAMPDFNQWRSFVYCTSLSGGLLGKVDHFKGQHLPYSDISPEPVTHLPQHKLVPMIAARAEDHPLIDLRMNQRVEGFCNNVPGEPVEMDVVCGTTGKRYNIHAKYLVAAEGAHSGIRKSLGINMDGPGTLQNLINIYFRSPELGRMLLEKKRMGMLYFIFNSNTIAVLVAHNLEEGEFVAQIPYFPPLQTAQEFTKSYCKKLVHQFSGMPSLNIDVVDVKSWEMGAAVATRYRTNNVFLVGDAAHIVPPAGAFGMNTGVQDAHNLAWKLAFVLKGLAGADLLDSYQAERQPVAIANMNLSVDNFHEALRVAKIIGLDFETAQSMNSILNGPLTSWAPQSIRRQMLGSAVSSGLFLGQALAVVKKSELDAVFDSGQTLRLQYPKEDLGFMYHGSSCAVCVEDEYTEYIEKEKSPKRREAPYEPITLPGCRFPHVPISHIHNPGPFMKRVSSITSTIDIPPAVGSSFALFMQYSKYTRLWDEAVARVKDIVTLVLLAPAESPSMHQDFLKDAITIAEIPKESYTQFEDFLARVGSQDAPVGVLVRPDGHIAWQGSDPAALSPSLSKILHHNVRV